MIGDKEEPLSNTANSRHNSVKTRILFEKNSETAEQMDRKEPKNLMGREREMGELPTTILNSISWHLKIAN